MYVLSACVFSENWSHVIGVGGATLYQFGYINYKQ